MYEHRSEPLAPIKVYYKRLATNTGYAFVILLLCLSIGIAGYHYIANIAWIDAIHNASMILSGMGPVVSIDNVAGKLFSSAYALFSGVVFITNIGLFLAPVAHRLLHKLHLESNDEGSY